MKDTPDDLGGELVAANRIQLHTAAQRKTEITYASNWGPKVVGMKRGAWKRTVDTVVWYSERPMATARFPGRNSARISCHHIG